MNPEEQALLARVLTDRAERERSRGRDVLGIAPADLERFAESLVSKRLAEARHALPGDAGHRGAHDAEFRAYARTHPRPPHGDPQADAHAFRRHRLLRAFFG